MLADLYARAGLFVFLSDYEGFGLTPLEALASGVPILVGDTPVAREVYGDAAQLRGHDRRGGHRGRHRTTALRTGRSGTASCRRRPASCRRYSWENAGRQTLAALLAAPLGGALMTDLAIVIVSYNVRADLARALQSLSDAPAGRPSRSDGGGQRLVGRQPPDGPRALARRPDHRRRRQSRVLQGQQPRHPCHLRRVGAAPQQRHGRAAGRDRRAGRPPRGRIPRRPWPARGWWTPTAGPRSRSDR